MRKGFKTVTPYIVAQNADSVIEFVKKTFGAEETERAVMPGGVHSEVRIEDSMLMIGGGITGVEWKRDSQLGAFHVYVRDCDAAYERAMEAGGEVACMACGSALWGAVGYGDPDPAGNFWYIATRLEGDYKWEGAPTVPALICIRCGRGLDRLFEAGVWGGGFGPICVAGRSRSSRDVEDQDFAYGDGRSEWSRTSR